MRNSFKMPCPTTQKISQKCVENIINRKFDSKRTTKISHFLLVSTRRISWWEDNIESSDILYDNSEVNFINSIVEKIIYKMIDKIYSLYSVCHLSWAHSSKSEYQYYFIISCTHIAYGALF